MGITITAFECVYSILGNAILTVLSRRMDMQSLSQARQTHLPVSAMQDWMSSLQVGWKTDHPVSGM